LSNELSVLGEAKEKLVNFIKDHEESEQNLISLKNEIVLVSNNLDKLKEEEFNLSASINLLNINNISLSKNVKNINILIDSLKLDKSVIKDDILFSEKELKDVKKEFDYYEDKILLLKQ
jgi:hypothetical protein